MRKHSAFFLFCAVLAVVLATGCAPAVKNIPVVEAPPIVVEEAPEEVAEVEEEEDDHTEHEDEMASDPGIIDITDVDNLLETARKACADSAFATADSVLRRVASFFMQSSADVVDGETHALSDYIADIISIYAEMMPTSYSVPEEISVLIFKQHLLESLLDTLQVSPQDSIFLHRLSNKRGVVYEVPMVWNDRVHRALMFYMRTRNGVFDRWLHRAGYYLPMMTQMFADSGLPRDLAYLPIIESGFNPHAYSRAHASGIWQFIPSTGRIYGLRQNYWIDERRDPIKSTEGAIKYLRKLYGDFGDWHIALASYNCGEGGMARAIRRADGLHDYWQLTLPKETMNYIPLFLASVLIARNPDVFDFAIQDSVVFDPDTVFVHDCIEMKTIAEGIEIQLDSLKRLNPHILHWCTPPDMSDIRLYLPKGKGDEFRAFYDTLSDVHKTKYYRYKVQNNDNLPQIARNFKVPIERLRDINRMTSNAVTAGRYIIIPVPADVKVPASLKAHLNTIDRKQQRDHAKLHAATAGPPLGSAPGRGRTSVPAAAQASGQRTTTGGQRAATVGQRTTTVGQRAAPSGKKISYKVRAGETLYSIAGIFGVTVAELMEWNFLASPRSLKAEQTLVIYQKDLTTPSTQRVSGKTTEHTGKHLVKQGETLYGISQAVGVPISELAQINGLNPRRPLIFPGDVLVYTPPAGRAAGSVATPAVTNTGTPSAPAPAAASAGSTPPAGGTVVLYKVKPGDNLWRISINHGTTVEAIRTENNLTADSALKPGDILRITSRSAN